MNDTEQLTPRQRGEITRKANAAARKAHREQRDAQEREDKARVAKAMRRIIDDQNSTPGQVIFAALLLHDIDWSFPLPLEAERALDDKPDKEAFAHAVKVLSQEYQDDPDTDQGEE